MDLLCGRVSQDPLILGFLGVAGFRTLNEGQALQIKIIGVKMGLPKPVI